MWSAASTSPPSRSAARAGCTTRRSSSTTGSATSPYWTCRTWTRPPLQFTGRRDARAATARSSRASRRTARTTCAAARVRGRIDANGPDIYHRGTVRRDVYSLYATVRQGNSGGPLLTPDGQGVRRGLRQVPRRRRHRLRADRGRDPRGHRQRAAPPTSRWTATAARSDGAGPGTGRSRREAVGRQARAVPRPSGPGGAGCAECPAGVGSAPVHLRGRRPAGGCSAARGRAAIACCVTVVVRPAHTPTSAPAPRSITAPRAPNWPMRAGNWLFVGHVFRSGYRAHRRGHRSGSGSFSQLMSSVEKRDRILLVREVPQPVEQPPAVRRFDVLAGPGRATRAHRRGRGSRADAASARAPAASCAG